MTGLDLYQELESFFADSKKKASEYLASIGIVGTRYLDGNSRSDGAGTHNYVIWDQPTLNRIALLERNGEKLDAIREADAARYNVEPLPRYHHHQRHRAADHEQQREANRAG